MEVLVRMKCTYCHGEKELFKIKGKMHVLGTQQMKLAMEGTRIDDYEMTECPECSGQGTILMWARMSCAHLEIIERAEDF